MKSKRIALAIMSNDRIVASMFEGEYDTGGISQAIVDAYIDALSYPSLDTDTHMAVIVFPIALDGKTRIIKKYPLNHNKISYRFSRRLENGESIIRSFDKRPSENELNEIESLIQSSNEQNGIENCSCKIFKNLRRSS